jgi:hypothetical protein
MTRPAAKKTFAAPCLAIASSATSNAPFSPPNSPREDRTLMTDTTTTDPPTLAEELRWIAGSDPGSSVADHCIHAADILAVIAPSTIEMVERVLTEDLPDGWTATAADYVVLTHDDGREIVATYCGEPLTQRFHWWRSCVSTDDDPDRQVGADTLAELIELVTS